MKILIIHPYSFLEYRGGVERYCATLEREVPAKQISGHYFNLFGQPFPKLELFSIIKAENPDILHAQGPSIFSTVVGVFGRILKIKTVLTYHANSNSKNYFKRIFSSFNRYLSKYVFDIVIVTSQNYKEKVERFFSKTAVAPLIVEEQFFISPREKSFNGKILFVGKLDKHHYYKGLETLIESVKSLPEDFKLVIIGDGDDKNRYQKLASSMNLNNRVEFRGEVGDLKKYYSKSDLLVLPSNSDSEGFGTVLLEAMAMYLPVIVSDKAGSAKIIKESGAGLIFSANNSSELAKSILLLRNKDLYNELQEKGRMFAEEFRIKNSTAKLKEIYQCLIKQEK